MSGSGVLSYGYLIMKHKTLLSAVILSAWTSVLCGQTSVTRAEGDPVSKMIGTPTAPVATTAVCGRRPESCSTTNSDATQIATSPDVWSTAYRQLQAGTMPPVGAARPDRATYDAVLGSIEKAMNTKVDAQPSGANSQEIATQPRDAPMEQRSPTPPCFKMRSATGS